MIWRDSLHETNNDDSVLVVNFGMSNSDIIRSTMFPYKKIEKYVWPSRGGKANNQTGHVLTDEK
jgi:hypothetical protein